MKNAQSSINYYIFVPFLAHWSWCGSVNEFSRCAREKEFLKTFRPLNRQIRRRQLFRTKKWLKWHFLGAARGKFMAEHTFLRRSGGQKFSFGEILGLWTYMPVKRLLIRGLGKAATSPFFGTRAMRVADHCPKGRTAPRENFSRLTKS